MHNGPMRSAMVACVLIAGCSFEHREVPNRPTDGGDPDGAGSDTVDGDGVCVTYSSLFNTCNTPMGTLGLTLTPGDWIYNTDTHVLSTSGISTMPTSMVIAAAAGPIDIIFVSSFTLQPGATLRGISPTMHRPFGIASTGAIQIDGVIDVASAGAGARTDTTCGTSTGGEGQDNGGGGGGGGGGGFHGRGGTGSKGNSDGPNTNAGSGGLAIARPPSPIGGCDGGRGGNGTGLGGAGGNGGGAVYLASATSVTIGGTIDAGGQFGAAGGQNGDAGGGGGAGGMILLESKTVTVAGVLVANGGGGGEGNTNGNPGQSGQRSASRALGGGGGDDNGGDGGDGGATPDIDGATTNDLRMGGGGGGGGAAGFVAIGCPAPAIMSSAIISPAFSVWP
jgi:hypothetical protein